MINTVQHIDCLIGMQSIADKSIDMILCDLPYGTTACKWDAIIPFEPLWKRYERIIKDNGAIVLTASQPFTSALVMSNPKIFKYEWIWDKVSHSNPFVARYRCLSVHENIVVFCKGKTKYNPQMNTNNFKKTGHLKNGKNLGDLFINKNSGSRRNSSEFSNPKSIITIKRNGAFGSEKEQPLHPTQKPVALFEYLIKTYTNEGETVLDNCAGSGTTALACINTNRNYIVMEKEEKYYKIIQSRIKEHTPQLKLAI